MEELAQKAEDGWKRVETIEVAGRAAVIGDIHGQADLLERLLAKLGPDVAIFVVGDVNDRGPDTKRVIDMLIARGARGVRGNHEEWLCRYAAGGGFDSLALNHGFGGRATLASYGIEGSSPREIEEQHRKVPHEHRDWLLSLPCVIRLTVSGTPFWIVHAGVSLSLAASIDPMKRMAEIARSEHWDLLWRSQEPDDMDVLDAPVIFGHVPRKAPIDAGHAIGIDTGSGTKAGCALTAVILPERRFVSVTP